MSRKDPRRAIAIALPPEVLVRLRARQKCSRGRRLMDTLRISLQQALAQPAPVLVPCPAAPRGTTIHLLQLPRDLQRRLAECGRNTGLTENDAICALVLGLSDLDHAVTQPETTDCDGAQRRMV